MSPWLVALTGCIYAYISGEQLVKGNVGPAIMWAGYAFANVGLWMGTK